MNACDDFQILIEMKAHGALDAEAAARVEAHLAGCGACRDYSQLVETMGRATKLELPQSIEWDRVRQRVRGVARAYRRGAMRVAIASACLAVLGLATGWPRPLRFAAGGALLVGAYCALAWLAARRTARVGNDPRGLLAACESDLARSLRSSKLAAGFCALSGLAWLASGFYFPILGPILAACFFALAAYWWTRIPIARSELARLR
jgi:hypothetical protein